MITIKNAPPTAPSTTPAPRKSWAELSFNMSVDSAERHLCSLYRAGPSEHRAFCVREWQRRDGGFFKWTLTDGRWTFREWPPRFPGELITIVRLEDRAIAVTPKRWWEKTLFGKPADVDDWAAPVWREIEINYAANLALVKNWGVAR
jgi:hypothetical protein